MKVKDLLLCDRFQIVTLPDSEREIDGVYVGDLLSWVMGRAKADNVWITIMSNLNVLGVASLADVSCVILAEGVTLDDEVKKTAEAQGINVLSTKMDIYNTSVFLSKSI